MCAYLHDWRVDVELMFLAPACDVYFELADRRDVQRIAMRLFHGPCSVSVGLDDIL